MSKTEKRVIARGTALRTFDEPQPGWVLLQDAIPYCGGEMFDKGTKAIDALHRVVDKKSKIHIGRLPLRIVGLEFTSRVAATDRGVLFETTGADGCAISTEFLQWGSVITNAADWADNFGPESWVVVSHYDQANSHELDWDKEVSHRDRNLAEVHRMVRIAVEYELRSKFQTFVQDGRVHIMARPTTLAPFQRIFWDQWQFFEVGKPERRATVWQEPRYSSSLPLSAASPSGERLYSIYAAPGVATVPSAHRTPEAMTTDWLIELMQTHAERAPGGITSVRAQAVAMFGVSERGFERCCKEAQNRTKNDSWSKRGRPQKIPH